MPIEEILEDMRAQVEELAQSLLTLFGEDELVDFLELVRDLMKIAAQVAPLDKRLLALGMIVLLNMLIRAIEAYGQ